MEGPTPVSALIHAATMVTAGVYMIARCGALFVTNEAAMITVAAVGAFTALFAATIALRQFDLKKVFAYSTVSQLGFMFVGVGVLAPVAGVFHLVTHAFFKALLFLASGVVMHAMAGELDMRKMSGLKRVLPRTRVLMLIGCCALAGLPLFSGFFSKDEIVSYEWMHSKLLGGVLLLTALLTAYYTFRLYFRVFEGPELIPAGVGHHAAHNAGEHEDEDEHLRVDTIHQQHAKHGSEPAPAAEHAEHHDHEPAIMIWPLIVLAIGAIFAGYFNWPGEKLGEFLGHSPSLSIAHDLAVRRYTPAMGAEVPDSSVLVSPVPFGQEDVRLPEVKEREHQFHLYMMIVSGLIAILGILLAYQMHLKDRAAADRAAGRFPLLVRLLDHKYWVDEIYQNGIVEPLRNLGRSFFWIDRWIVDGLVWIAGFVPQLSGFALKLTTQRGYLQGYALTMILGIAVILLIVFL
jgi:NADH-quinone oxidoreductase subunit L